MPDSVISARSADRADPKTACCTAPTVAKTGRRLPLLSSTASTSPASWRGNGVAVVTGNSFTFGTQESTTPGLFRPSSTINPGPLGTPPGTMINIAGLATSGLPAGDYTDICNAPGNTSAMYTAVVNTADATQAGIYSSTDAGQTWTQVYTAPAGAVNIKLAGRDNTFSGPTTVFAAIATGTNASAQLSNVVRTANGGATWQDMMVPTTVESGNTFGVNPGGQGQVHLAITADPTNPNIVYVGGDRQPAGNEGTGNPATFPNSIGANTYSGRLFAGTFDTTASTTTWAPITNNGTNGGAAPGSSPHADSRTLAFVGSTLYEGGDGGIYAQSNPTNNTGVWSSAIGTGLQVTEVYGVAYDSNAKIIMDSNQDTGVAQQTATGSKAYTEVPTSFAGFFLTGDGGVVLAAPIAGGRSIRYASSNGLSLMQSAVYGANNQPIAGMTQFLNLTEVDGMGNPLGKTLNQESFAKTPAPATLNTADNTGRRIVIGTSASATVATGAVWESTDGGNTFATVGAIGAGESVFSVIAGGRQAGVNNINVLFAGTNGPAVYRRTAAAGGLSSLTGYGGGTAWDLAVDSSNWANLFVDDITNNKLWRSTNADAAVAADVNFTDITGNLLAVAGATFVPQTSEQPGEDAHRVFGA